MWKGQKINAVFLVIIPLEIEDNKLKREFVLHKSMAILNNLIGTTISIDKLHCHILKEEFKF